jgi:hypothetical protein
MPCHGPSQRPPLLIRQAWERAGELLQARVRLLHHIVDDVGELYQVQPGGQLRHFPRLVTASHHYKYRCCYNNAPGKPGTARSRPDQGVISAKWTGVTGLIRQVGNGNCKTKGYVLRQALAAIGAGSPAVQCLAVPAVFGKAQTQHYLS